MLIMAVGMLLFFGSHLVPLLPVSSTFQDKFGVKKYKGLIALPSVIGIILIVIGYRQASIESLWLPVPYGREMALHLMPVAFILLAAAHMKTNIRRFIKHPMLTGILIWAVLHLLNNGEVRAVILFSAFAVYAVLDMLLTKKSKAAQRYPIKKDVIVVVAGMFTYVVVLFAHGWAGVPLF